MNVKYSPKVNNNLPKSNFAGNFLLTHLLALRLAISEQHNYSLAYEEFTVPLVKSIQELNAIVTQQNELIATLQKEVEELKTKMASHKE